MSCRLCDFNSDFRRDDRSITSTCNIKEGMEQTRNSSVFSSTIKNKFRKIAIHQKIKSEHRKERRQRKKKRKEEEESLGDMAPPKKVPKTLENTREYDETMVQPDDAEVFADEETDEFSEYFKGQRTPKLLITTCIHPSSFLRRFVNDLLRIFPNSFFYSRRFYRLKDICTYASKREFTDLIVLNEHRKVPCIFPHPTKHSLTADMWLVHLPHGPTAHFRLSSVRLARTFKDDVPTHHHPELMLNNFGTRLGHTVGRMLAALFPQNPNFMGRQVVTFHNQRDYIFFRFHRYIFEGMDKVRLQELGPRFCLKLRTLQRGLFNKKEGEYEFVWKRQLETSRRKFFL